MMDKHGKSDRFVVPENSPNADPERPTEAGEGRERTKGNTPERTAPRTQGRTGAPSALERVRQAAQQDRKQRFTALLHHVYDIERLRAAFFAMERAAAAGIDGETWQHYGAALEANLQDLSERLKRGAYRAKPVRRVYIPKTDGRQRPLGVPTLEDKIVQRAVVAVLNAIYDTDFLGFSYGFRSRAQSPSGVGRADGRHHDEAGAGCSTPTFGASSIRWSTSGWCDLSSTVWQTSASCASSRNG